MLPLPPSSTQRERDRAEVQVVSVENYPYGPRPSTRRLGPSRRTVVDSGRLGRLDAVTAGLLLLGRMRRSHGERPPLDGSSDRRAGASRVGAGPQRQRHPVAKPLTLPPSSSPGRRRVWCLRAGGAGRRRAGRARGPAVGWITRQGREPSERFTLLELDEIEKG